MGIDYRLSRSGPPQPPRPEPPRPPGPPRPQPPPGRVDFTLPTPINGVAFCDDTTMGGQPNSAVVGCVDVGRGNNHASEVVRNGCRAVEGNGNGGYAQCQTQCRSSQTEFVVRNYGEPFTSCTDMARGGRPGAQVLACIDVGRGNNHSCRMQVGGCLAVEGDGNGGYAACEARCK